MAGKSLEMATVAASVAPASLRDDGAGMCQMLVSMHRAHGCADIIVSILHAAPML